jgi:hypothetical protein
MATASILPPPMQLRAEERSLLERAIQRGYVVDKTYASSLARAYTDWAWRAGRPTVVCSPGAATGTQPWSVCLTDCISPSPASNDSTTWPTKL